MAEEQPKVWSTPTPEGGRVVWTDEYRSPEMERLIQRAQIERWLRSRKERGV